MPAHSGSLSTTQQPSCGLSLDTHRQTTDKPEEACKYNATVLSRRAAHAVCGKWVELEIMLSTICQT